MSQQAHKKVTPRRLRPPVRLDQISPSDYLIYKTRFACEDCTHFNANETSCTLGYESKWHLREVQEKSYLLSGSISFCRFIEID